MFFACLVNVTWLVTVAILGGGQRNAADLHQHITMAQAAKPFFHGEPGHGGVDLTWSPRIKLRNQVETEHLLRTQTRVVVATVWPPVSLRPGRGPLDEALNQLEQLHAFARRHPEYSVVSTPEEARRAVAHGRIALIPAVEGGEGIAQVSDVDRLWAAGARSLTLMHLGDGPLGGSAAGQTKYNSFDIIEPNFNPLGLTELGREVVKRMLELGMIIDLAHASDQTSEEVLSMAEEYGAPVVNTHGGARAFLPIERNTPDALVARITKGGGMVGVTLSDHQTARVPEGAKWEGYVDGSCDDIVAHWKQLLSAAASPEQLAVGSDWNGWILRAPPGGSCPNGLRNTGDLTDFYDALVKHGVPEAAIDGMGEQFLKTWDAVSAKATVQAREEAREADAHAASPFDVAM